MLATFRADCAARAKHSWVAGAISEAEHAVVYKTAGVYAGHIRRAVLGLQHIGDAIPQSQRLVDGTWERRARVAARRRRVNLLLNLPAASALQTLPLDACEALACILIDLALANRTKAERDWARHKSPMALYARYVASYAKHLARAARDPEGSSHE
jgi:hypothetical protein